MVAYIIAEQPRCLCIIASCRYFAFDLTMSFTNIFEIRINKSELPSAPQEFPLKPLILPQSLWISLSLCWVGLDQAGRT